MINIYIVESGKYDIYIEYYVGLSKLSLQQGQDCSQCISLPGCKNGYCEKAFDCKCKEGWTGAYCEKGTKILFLEFK